MIKVEIRQVFIIALIFLYNPEAVSQHRKLEKLHVKKDLLVILRDTTFVTRNDTTLLLAPEELKRVRLRPNPYRKSSQFYDSLVKRGKAHSLTRDILDLVVKSRKQKKTLVSAVIKSEDIFKPFAGLTIGSISYKHVDLIEGSVMDTLQEASSRFSKFVNKIHIDTRAIIIKQNLLFTVGDHLDPYKLADNERILRQLSVLRDVRIYVEVNKDNPLLVDVIVITQDVSSLGAGGSYSSLKKYRLDVYDVNILGYAKQFKVSYFRSASETSRNGYALALRETNILGTFIQGEVEYTDNYQRKRTGLSLNRDFFTPEIKYAGGLTVHHTNEIYFFEAYDTLESAYREKNMDVWAGRSFQFRDRINFIFTGRINTRNFINKSLQDSIAFFNDRTTILGSTTLTKRNFIKSLRVQGFGKTEDIPVGQSIGITVGREMNEFVNRSYFQLNGTLANYFDRIGYINLSIAIGGYYKKPSLEDGLIDIVGTYFSNLMEIRRFQLRQFIYFSYIKGFNRLIDQTVSIAGKWKNAESIPPLGVERTTFGLETVYFMQWYTYGFQFALFHRIDLNLLLSYEAPQTNRKLFPSIRCGARMLNENLVLPTFALELAYYGKNGDFNSAWEFKISATLSNLFSSNQTFKPRVHNFR